MFSALRQNSILYVLNKQDVTLSKVQVVSVTAPKPKVNTLYSNPLDTYVDIVVKQNEVQQEYKNLPSNLSLIVDGNLVISETKEGMNAEVEALLTVSKQTLESVPYHQKVVTLCDDILKELNPQFAKEKAQEEKITSLEHKIGGIEASLGDMKQMLSQALHNNVTV